MTSRAAKHSSKRRILGSLNKDMAITYAQELVNGGYNNDQIQLKLRQVFGIENMEIVNKFILEELK